MRPAPPLRPRKSLGQNFLRDPNIIRNIVSSLRPGKEDILLEIGPGEGALTHTLAPRVGKLIVVDVDERVIRRMEDRYPDGEVEILHSDFLALDLGRLAGQYGSRLRIVGNIPYNITTPILFHLLDHRHSVVDAMVMVQREVAKRLVAVPGTKEYGILSVIVQLLSDVVVLFDVSPNAFYPRPTVTSSVLQITPLQKTRFPVADEAYFRAMVRAVFGKRRKTLRNSLQYFLDKEPGSLPADTDLQRRPEQLTIHELVTLSNRLWSLRRS